MTFWPSASCRCASRRVERVQRDVVLRVVADLEAVRDEPAQQLAAPRHAGERLAVDEERAGEREARVLLLEREHDPDRRVGLDAAVRVEEQLLLRRVVERHHDRRLARPGRRACPATRSIGAHRPVALAPEPRQLGAELLRRQVVVAAAVRADLVVHQHRHLAELVRRQRRGRRGVTVRLRRRGRRGRRLRRALRGHASAPRQPAARVGHGRVPEQPLVDAVVARGLDLRRDLRRPVVDAEREVLQPRHDACARALAPAW